MESTRKRGRHLTFKKHTLYGDACFLVSCEVNDDDLTEICSYLNHICGEGHDFISVENGIHLVQWPNMEKEIHPHEVPVIAITFGEYRDSTEMIHVTKWKRGGKPSVQFDMENAKPPSKEKRHLISQIIHSYLLLHKS